MTPVPTPVPTDLPRRRFRVSRKVLPYLLSLPALLREAAPGIELRF